MFLYQKMDTDFVLVEADWPVEKGRDLVCTLKPQRVIIRLREKDGSESYYLYNPKKFDDLVKDKNSKDYLRNAIAWDKSDAAPILADTLSTADLTTADAPAKGVVMSDGRLSGFWEREDFRGVTRGGSPKGGARLVGRSLQAGFPAKVALHETRTLTVWLTGSGKGVPLKSRVPVDAKLSIKVEAKKGFEIDGPDHGLLEVKDPPDDKGLDFKLHSTSVGTGEIWVWAFLNGFEMAGLSLTPQVEASPSGNDAVVKNQNSITALPSEHPDLFLTISEQWRNGKRGFSMNIHCPSQEIYSEQYDFVPFERDPGEYFEGFYQDIESLDLSTEAARIRAAELLEDKGAHLCDLLPSGLQQLLWKLRDSITSIFIQSDEPWIPWELCRPSGKVNDHYEEGKFWCESFAMTRWLRAVQHQSIKPALNLTLNCIATVIPDNPDLLYSIKEEDYLHSYNKGGRVVKSIPPTFQRLQIAMESGLYDGWHFSGHGIFNYSDPDRSEIRLRDGALKPENLSGRARNLGSKCRPLVFLNACQIGRGGKSLTGVGGWASRFLDAGAGAFIGPLWSVYDRPAYKFAEVLYAELFKGSNIGEAVKLARIAIKETGDPSWLAYSVFAYPMAKVSS